MNVNVDFRKLQDKLERSEPLSQSDVEHCFEVARAKGGIDAAVLYSAVKAAYESQKQAVQITLEDVAAASLKYKQTGSPEDKAHFEKLMAAYRDGGQTNAGTDEPDNQREITAEELATAAEKARKSARIEDRMAYAELKADKQRYDDYVKEGGE